MTVMSASAILAPMVTLSRIHKERALKAHGIALPPFPVPPPAHADGVSMTHSDQVFLKAIDGWDMEIDRRYKAMCERMPRYSPSARVLAFVREARESGLRCALTNFNAQVPHRFTGLYRLDHRVMKSVHMIDKSNEAAPDLLRAVSLPDSFCQYVVRDGEFRTNDSVADARLNGHPGQGVVTSYHGVPVLDGRGDLYGSLCHFDLGHQPLGDDDFAHLTEVATALGAMLGDLVRPLDEVARKLQAAGIDVPPRPTMPARSLQRARGEPTAGDLQVDAEYQRKFDAWALRAEALDAQQISPERSHVAQVAAPILAHSFTLRWNEWTREPA